jgi:hypothetical protein
MLLASAPPIGTRLLLVTSTALWLAGKEEVENLIGHSLILVSHKWMLHVRVDERRFPLLLHQFNNTANNTPVLLCSLDYPSGVVGIHGSKEPVLRVNLALRYTVRDFVEHQLQACMPTSSSKFFSRTTFSEGSADYPLAL